MDVGVENYGIQILRARDTLDRIIINSGIRPLTERPDLRSVTLFYRQELSPRSAHRRIPNHRRLANR